MQIINREKLAELIDANVVVYYSTRDLAEQMSEEELLASLQSQDMSFSEIKKFMRGRILYDQYVNVNDISSDEIADYESRGIGCFAYVNLYEWDSLRTEAEQRVWHAGQNVAELEATLSEKDFAEFKELYDKVTDVFDIALDEEHNDFYKGYWTGFLHALYFIAGANNEVIYSLQDEPEDLDIAQ